MLTFSPEYKIFSKIFFNIFASFEFFSIFKIHVNFKRIEDEPIMRLWIFHGSQHKRNQIANMNKRDPTLKKSDQKHN